MGWRCLWTVREIQATSSISSYHFDTKLLWCRRYPRGLLVTAATAHVCLCIGTGALLIMLAATQCSQGYTYATAERRWSHQWKTRTHSGKSWEVAISQKYRSCNICHAECSIICVQCQVSSSCVAGILRMFSGRCASVPSSTSQCLCRRVAVILSCGARSYYDRYVTRQL